MLALIFLVIADTKKVILELVKYVLDGLIVYVVFEVSLHFVLLCS